MSSGLGNIASSRLGARCQGGPRLSCGPEGTDIRDRLTNLINGKHGFGMKGFREALLTKVLCMVEPQRFVPIFTYTGKAGKKEYTESIYGPELPSPKAVSLTVGRLIFWSNDLLRGLVGEGFEDTWHAAEFLYYAKVLTASSAVDVPD